MKKLYTIFAVTFLLNLFAGLHWSFANDKLPKETLPVSNPKPVYKNPFKQLPFKAILPNVELYEFNHKAYAFDKIVGLQPILVGKEWQTVTNDPIRFTLTPSKKTAMLGEEIELTLTAELLDISPRLLFTLEELRNYSIKVILPQDFIQTGGTYLNFATGTLDPTNSKHTYTIKGRYLDKPALDDCFKVLRKLNDDVFVLKNTACINVTDVDSQNSVVAETNNAGREVLTGIDISKINITSLSARGHYEITDFGSSNTTFYYSCKDDGSIPVLNTHGTNVGEVTSKNGSVKIKLTFLNSDNTTLIKEFSSNFVAYPFPDLSIKVTIELYIYSGLNNSGTLLGTKSQEIIINRGPCPTNSTLSISTNETSLCPGASTTISTNTNCPATSISWQKNNEAYGSNGATTSVSTSGIYKAVCNNPAMVSNTVTINVSNTPTVPNIITNRNSITPGEFATLTATNCQGTVVWQGPNNFTDTGDEISVGKQGNYQALCRSNCNGTTYYSDLSAIVGISLLPLRLEADKYEKYSNETAQISAYGCNNGYISWKVNGAAIPQSDNPLTAYSAGTYSAQCRSFSGTESDWVALYISEKTSTTPRVTASKTHAYPTDNVTLSASGCPSGWYYKWEIPVRASDNSVTYQYPVGTPQTVQGPATYKVQCILNDQNQSAYESVTVNTLDIGQVIINISANKTEANIGEPVVFTVTGSCPNGGGIRWMVNGMNYWSYVGETFTGIGPGTYDARCESGPQISPTVSYIVKPPKAGGVSIVSDKTRAKDNELVTLRAIGCNNEVIWTLPDNTEVRGSTILFNFGPGLYKAKCVNKFGFTSEQPASLTIANRNWDEPMLIQTNTSVATNQLGEMQIQGCPNDWVQWAIPRKDANGNEVKDANGQTIYDYTGGKILIFKGPGVYKVRCSAGDYSYNFQNIVVQAAPTNALFLKASRNVAKPDESVTITAYGCPNGTVTWKNGNLTATGTQITVTGPGVRMAKCTGDYSNNGDWALAQIRNDGNITPYLNASVYEACPNQPVNITATGCPNGWWYQTRWIKPDKLDYWLANRNAPIWEVYNYGGSNETKNGPNLYSARCISPDGSWMGDFDEKSITVEPAFPDDLRATNNGPAMVGDVSVRLAVTDVPNASYAWSGPNTFASGLRNPEITALTAAKSGIYTVTLNKGTGQAWGCNATATTNVKITESTFMIKSKDAITSEETNVLPTSTNPAVPYGSLALSVENIDGSPMVDYTYSWTSAFQTLSEPTQPFVVINNPGIYQVTIGRVGNPNWSQKLTISITTNNTRTESWTQMREATFINGTPVKIVPLKYSGQDLFIIDNNSKVSPPASEIALATTDVYKSKASLLVYTQNSIVKKDIMIVTPDFEYAKTHTTWGNDFTGKVTFRSLDEKTFLAGWRYQNGNVIGRIHEFIANYNVADDDCYDVKFIKQVTVGGDAKSLSDRGYVNTNVVEIIDGQSYGRWEKKVPCSASGNPPLILTGGDPNNVNWAAVNFPRETILGGGVSVPRPPNEKFGLMLTEFFSQVFRNEQIHLHRPDDIISNKADARKFTLLVKLIIASIKKEYPCISGMPTDIVIRDANTLFANGKVQEAGALLATGMGVGCSEAQLQEITAKIPEMMGKIKSTFLMLSKFLEDCTSSTTPQGARTTNTTPTANPCPGELLVWDILDKLIARGKNPADVLMSFNGQPIMNTSDATNLWSDLSAGLTVSTENGIQKVTRTDGTIITFSNNPLILQIKSNTQSLIIKSLSIPNSIVDNNPSNNLPEWVKTLSYSSKIKPLAAEGLQNQGNIPVRFSDGRTGQAYSPNGSGANSFYVHDVQNDTEYFLIDGHYIFRQYDSNGKEILYYWDENDNKWHKFVPFDYPASMSEVMRIYGPSLLEFADKTERIFLATSIGLITLPVSGTTYVLYTAIGAFGVTFLTEALREELKGTAYLEAYDTVSWLLMAYQAGAFIGKGTQYLVKNLPILEANIRKIELGIRNSTIPSKFKAVFKQLIEAVETLRTQTKGNANNKGLTSSSGQPLSEIGDVIKSENGEIVVLGKYSKRDFNPNNVGGAILDLDWTNATINQAGINEIQTHLARLAPDVWNDRMIVRLNQIKDGLIPVTDFDKRFYTHELRELQRCRNMGISDVGAIPWDDVHAATLEDYKLYEKMDYNGQKIRTLYHPSVQIE